MKKKNTEKRVSQSKCLFGGVGDISWDYIHIIIHTTIIGDVSCYPHFRLFLRHQKLCHCLHVTSEVAGHWPSGVPWLGLVSGLPPQAGEFFLTDHLCVSVDITNCNLIAYYMQG